MPFRICDTWPIDILASLLSKILDSASSFRNSLQDYRLLSYVTHERKGEECPRVPQDLEVLSPQANVLAMFRHLAAKGRFSVSFRRSFLPLQHARAHVRPVAQISVVK
jgi:hypothetical protein